MTPVEIPELSWIDEAKIDLIRRLPLLVPFLLFALWMAQ